MRRGSLRSRILLALGAAWLTGVAGMLAIGLLWPVAPWLAAMIVLGTLVIAASLPVLVLEPVRNLLRALSASIECYRSGDFSQTLIVDRRDELGSLLEQHNELGRVLREQRQHLVQRELLLDTIVQNSPVVLVLVDAHRRVVYTNKAAQILLPPGIDPQGRDLPDVLTAGPSELREAFEAGTDSLFTFMTAEHVLETWHLSTRRILLNWVPHRLYLLNPMTRKLSRQEVTSLRKLIRVMSHEINNSLAPISSLAHTGAALVQRGAHESLLQVFEGIGERARHLQKFIAGYISIARLPVPQRCAVAWHPYLESLKLHTDFQLRQPLPETDGWFDPAQIEQVLINLLKNAHEAGSPAQDVELRVAAAAGGVCITVSDRGCGMSEAVLTSALLPFYSTKRAGTGLGLALAREIVEAHDGKLTLSNREGGGVSVSLWLPALHGAIL